jgi:hypothetical protein
MKYVSLFSADSIHSAFLFFFLLHNYFMYHSSNLPFVWFQVTNTIVCIYLLLLNKRDGGTQFRMAIHLIFFIDSLKRIEKELCV